MEYGGISKSFRSHEASFHDFASQVIVQHVVETLEPILRDTPRGGGNKPAPVEEPERAPIDKIGIIGAGVAGLYAAMILEDLGVPYEIIEANERIGGRIYTHRFNGEAGKKAPVDDPSRYDYFDVGAMRYPRLWFMARVFKLFDRIGINNLLREYKYSAPNTILYYNNRRVVPPSTDTAAKGGDPFHVSEANGGTVADSYVSQGVDYWTGETFGYFKNLFMEVENLPEDQRPAAFAKAWEELMRQDHNSTRGYMLAGLTGKPPGAPGPFPGPVVEWLETFDSATGLYDQAFSESVIDSLDFGSPNPQTCTKPLCDGPGEPSFQKKDLPGHPEWHWVCIDGGSDRMIDGMLSKLKDWKSKIKTKTPVTRISEKPDKKGLTVECRSANETFEYSQIILTAPLGCIQSIDLDDCGLLYNQKLAIRSLQYDASTKVGIKFEKRWWEDPEFMNNRPIVGGISNTDLPIRVCVYPSYGLTCPTSSPPPGILLASYTWAQDARRLGSLAQGKGSEPDKALLELVLDNIAKLHGIPRSKLPQPIDHFAHSWYNDQYTRGAFALFGPAQFGRAGGGGKISPGSMFASMKAPAADGKLHFAGEATSAHHAWVLGSLNSAWRAVFNALNGYDDLQQKLRDNWGTPDEEGPTNLKKLALLAHYGYL